MLLHLAMSEPTDHLHADAVETGRLSTDEGLGDDSFGGSDTDSLASTLLRHREFYGRTYHKYRAGVNDYWAPNDDQQIDAYDIRHEMLNLVLGSRLFLAPIQPDACQVLDVGCGSGLWSIDFADTHPQIQVEGIDLSPVQPVWAPPNCRFVIDDAEDTWTHQSNHFDFVHIRCLLGAIRDWPKLYEQAYRALKPGCWIQHLDLSMFFTSDDGSVVGDHILRQWSQTFVDCGERIGKTFLVTEKAMEWLREAQFEDVQQKWYKVPVGPWAKDPVCGAASSIHVDRPRSRLTLFWQNLKKIGRYNYHYCDTGAEGWALHLLINVLGWPIESCQVFIAQFREALKDRRNHAYYHV